MTPQKPETLTYLWSYPRRPKLTSRVIRWRIHRPYSHVAIELDVTYLGPVVFQASHGMVHLVSSNRFREHNRVLYSAPITITRSQKRKALQWLVEQLGKRYSVAGAIASTIKPLRKRGVGDNDATSFICSELAARLHNLLFNSIDANLDYIEPRDFERAVLRDGYAIYGDEDRYENEDV